MSCISFGCIGFVLQFKSLSLEFADFFIILLGTGPTFLRHRTDLQCSTSASQSATALLLQQGTLI
jgi:hypothetical protein